MEKTRSLTLAISIMGLINLAACEGSIHSTISAFDAEDCAPVVQEKLDKLGIDDEIVEKIEYLNKFYTRGRDIEVNEYEAWVRFASCPGTLVIAMDNACFITRLYPSAGCTKFGNPVEEDTS